MSNQYQAKLSENEHGYKVSFWDGDTPVFETSNIPREYKLLADMLHSTLEVALAFGFMKRPQEPQD